MSLILFMSGWSQLYHLGDLKTLGGASHMQGIQYCVDILAIHVSLHYCENSIVHGCISTHTYELKHETFFLMTKMYSIGYK